MRKVLLCILDGWGHGSNPEVSAIAQADTKYIDSLYDEYPNAELVTHGLQVGLPDGQMGNSEVGHLNIGAGRIVYQELARINKAVDEDAFSNNDTFCDLVAYAQNNAKPVHLMGLLSDGGVHSHIEHIIALAKKLSSENIKVYIHAFLDGRDTSPTGGVEYIEHLMQQMPSNAMLSSVIGRYYAMDRDSRWERIKKAYDLLVNGEGVLSSDIVASLKAQYANNITDEFMDPIKLGSANEGTIQEGDAVLFANFRTDRPRQLTRVLTQEDMPDAGMKTLDLYYVTMTEYDESFKDIKVIFEKDKISNTIGEVVANAGLKQLRIAETEKYPHVTFFLSGGREEVFDNEYRILVNSPKVATYDLQPEMSAPEVTDKLISFMETENPNLIVLNYANADMVGHTGVFPAAVKAAETLDNCLERLIPEALKNEYSIIVIADHGNSDIMVNPDGSPHTSHTTNPVPIILIDALSEINAVKGGKLADIAPTILTLMGLKCPEEMDGSCLF